MPAATAVIATIATTAVIAATATTSVIATAAVRTYPFHCGPDHLCLSRRRHSLAFGVPGQVPWPPGARNGCTWHNMAQHDTTWQAIVNNG